MISYKNGKQRKNCKNQLILVLIRCNKKYHDVDELSRREGSFNSFPTFIGHFPHFVVLFVLFNASLQLSLSHFKWLFKIRRKLKMCVKSTMRSVNCGKCWTNVRKNHAFPSHRMNWQEKLKTKYEKNNKLRRICCKARKSTTTFPSFPSLLRTFQFIFFI